MLVLEVHKPQMPDQVIMPSTHILAVPMIAACSNARQLRFGFTIQVALAIGGS